MARGKWGGGDVGGGRKRGGKWWICNSVNSKNKVKLNIYFSVLIYVWNGRTRDYRNHKFVMVEWGNHTIEVKTDVPWWKVSYTLQFPTKMFYRNNSPFWTILSWKWEGSMVETGVCRVPSHFFSGNFKIRASSRNCLKW